eukprot:gene29061-35075_t
MSVMSINFLLQARAKVFSELHAWAEVDPTKLRIVPHKADAFAAYGTATDVCLSSKAASGQPARSFVYSCTDNTWSLAMYNSSNCADADFISTNTFSVAPPGECGVYPPGSNTDDTTPQYVARYHCEAGATASLKADYVLSKYYDGDSCSELGSFSGPRNRGCFPYQFDNQTFSVKTTYPSEKFYNNVDCTGEILLSDSLAALQDTCVAPTDDGPGDDDVDSMKWTAFTSSVTCTVPSTTKCGASDSSGASLSTGALIGVIVGAVVGSVLLLVVIYLAYRSCCKKADSASSTINSVPV